MTTSTLEPTTTNEGFPERFIQVCPSDNFTLFLQASGDAWSCGENSRGQLGNQSSETNFTPLIFGSGFIKLDVGQFHAGGLDVNRRLFLWGDGWHGEQAIDPNLISENVDERFISLPTQRASAVLDFALGNARSFYINSGGLILACGENTDGILGTVSTETHVRDFELVVTPEGIKFVKIDAGMDHFGAIDENGALWLWGSNEFNKLSLSGETLKVATKVIDANVRSVSCGEDFTIATLTNGRVLAVGKGGWGSTLNWFDVVGQPSRDYALVEMWGSSDPDFVRGMKIIYAGFSEIMLFLDDFYALKFVPDITSGFRTTKLGTIYSRYTAPFAENADGSNNYTRSDYVFLDVTFQETGFELYEPQDFSLDGWGSSNGDSIVLSYEIDQLTTSSTTEEPTTSTSSTTEDPTTSTSTSTTEDPATSTSSTTEDPATSTSSTTEDPATSTSTSSTTEEPTTSTSSTTEEPTTSTSSTTEEPTTSTTEEPISVGNFLRITEEKTKNSIDGAISRTFFIDEVHQITFVGSGTLRISPNGVEFVINKDATNPFWEIVNESTSTTEEPTTSTSSTTEEPTTSTSTSSTTSTTQEPPPTEFDSLNEFMSYWCENNAGHNLISMFPTTLSSIENRNGSYTNYQNFSPQGLGAGDYEINSSGDTIRFNNPAPGYSHYSSASPVSGGTYNHDIGNISTGGSSGVKIEGSIAYANYTRWNFGTIEGDELQALNSSSHQVNATDRQINQSSVSVGDAFENLGQYCFHTIIGNYSFEIGSSLGYFEAKFLITDATGRFQYVKFYGQAVT